MKFIHAVAQRLRSMVHEIVGRINGRYGTLTENPIHHLDRQLSFHEVRHEANTLNGSVGKLCWMLKQSSLHMFNMQSSPGSC